MEEPTLAALPAEMLTSIFHWCNAATLARMACTSHDQHTAATSYGNERLRKLGDQTKADTQLPVLLLLQLKEARERAIDGEQRVSVARSASGSGARRGAAPFVALTSPFVAHPQPQSQPPFGCRMLGGTMCGGKLHEHRLEGSWRSACFGHRHLLLVTADGSGVLAFGQGLTWQQAGTQMVDVACLAAQPSSSCECEPCEDDSDDGFPSNGAYLTDAHHYSHTMPAPSPWVGTGFERTVCGVPLALPAEERAVRALACPTRAYVLTESGSVLVTHALRQPPPSSTPLLPLQTLWTPPSPEGKVVQISSLYYHLLLCTAGGSAFSLGDAYDGKLGFHHESYLSSPHPITRLAAYSIVGVAAGGGHSLFLTSRGEVFSCGNGEMGQLGVRGAASPPSLAPTPTLPQPHP